MEKESYLASHIAIDLAIRDMRISVYDILNWAAPGLRKIFFAIMQSCKKEYIETALRFVGKRENKTQYLAPW